MSEANGRTHHYHADATILEGDLQLPLSNKSNKIQSQAHAALGHVGGYFNQRQEDFRLEGVVSFSAAYSQVAGNLEVKPGRGWATLSTTVVEDLNILEILTADRIVGQIITEHPLEGYVPIISFLGTRFENLRIAGHPVTIDYDHDILGDKPPSDAAYTLDSALRARVADQYSHIHATPELPQDLREKYNQLSSALGGREAVECSLVKHVVGAFPGRSFGNVIRIPHFGTVTLAKLQLIHDQFSDHGAPRTTTVKLTMLDLNLGCAVSGSGSVGAGSTNGETRP
jgi:hypothetical protein